MDPDNAQTPKQQSLAEFLHQTIVDINDKKDVTAEFFLAKAQTYAELQKYFTVKPEMATQLLLLEPSEARQLMRDICSNPNAIAGTGAPEGAQTLTQFRDSEQKFASSVPNQLDVEVNEQRFGQAKKAIKDYYKSNEARVLKFRELLTQQKYDAILKERDRENIQKAIEQSPTYGLSLEEIRQKTIATILENYSAGDRHEATEVIRQAIQESGIDTEIATVNRAITETTKVILENPDIITTSIVVEEMGRGRTAAQATHLARMATVVQELPKQYGAKAASDAIAAVVTDVWPGISNTTFQKKFAQAWDAAGGDKGIIAEMTSRLGANLDSQKIQNFINEGTRLASENRGGFGGFGEPKAAKEDVYDYVQLSYTQGGPDPKTFWGAVGHTNHLDLFFMHGSPLNGLFKLGAKKEAAGTIAKGVAGVGVKGTAKDLSVKFLSAIGLAKYAGALGGPVSWIISGALILGKPIGNMLSRLAAGGIGGVKAASGAASEWVGGAIGSVGSYRGEDKNTQTIALLVIGGVAFLFVFAGSYDSFIRAQFQPVGIGGATNTPVVDCRATQTNELCNADIPPVGVDCNITQSNPQCRAGFCIPQKPGDCMWPASGYITQGPHTYDNVCDADHGRMDAIDIGAPYGTPVISIRNGHISYTSYYDSNASRCADQPGGGASTTYKCNFGWGNRLEITSDDGYVFRFGHLALQSISRWHIGDPVRLGQEIGKMDNNGFSTGNHLHFEVVSGPTDILSIVPLTKEEANEVNHCVIRCAAHLCPPIQTSITVVQ